MENQEKINLYTQEYLNELNSSGLLNFNPLSKLNLRITNKHYEDIFSFLMDNKTLKIANFDLSSTTLTQALNEGENDNLIAAASFKVFSDLDYLNQNNKLTELINNKEQTYLTFGLLSYFDPNNPSEGYSAPLVLLPIKINQEDNHTFTIHAINNEMYFNDALMQYLKANCSCDISYPLDNNFSLLEYLSYIANKVNFFHYEVNNGCFITNFNLNNYYIYNNYLRFKEPLSNLQLTKAISFLNPEFYNLNKPIADKIPSRLLSLLNVDNEEYNLMKKIGFRENLFIKTNTKDNKGHLFSNIIYNFLMNDKNIVITYDDEKSLQEINEFLTTYHLNKFAIELNPSTTNKKELINNTLNLDYLDYDIKLLDQTNIDKITDNYYLLKNNYKKMINTLRKTNEPLNLTINNAIFKYYCYYSYPLINTQIEGSTFIDEDKLHEYLKNIELYAYSINKLKCFYKEHAFYGFNKLDLEQADYLNLKIQMQELSKQLPIINHTFDILDTKYKMFKGYNLDDLKLLLDLGDLIPLIYKIKPFVFEEKNPNLIVLALTTYNSTIKSLNEQRNVIINLYKDKVFLIDHEKLLNAIKENEINLVNIGEYQEYFDSSVTVDYDILVHLSKELEAYYNLENTANQMYQDYQTYSPYYHEGYFLVDKLEDDFALVNNYHVLLVNIKDRGFTYSLDKSFKFNDKTIVTFNKNIAKCHEKYDYLVNQIESLQNYFDEELIILKDLSLKEFENKISTCALNFVSINDYLDFYLTKKKINKLFNGLGDELLSYQPNDFSNLFLKRFYYDYAYSYMKNSNVFNLFSEENLLLNMSHFDEYDLKRHEIINALIKHNIKNKINKNLIALKSIEKPYLNELNNKNLKVLPLDELLYKCHYTFNSVYPIHIVSSKDFCHILDINYYNYNLCIHFSNEETLTKDMLPILNRSEQSIIFDNLYLNDDNLINHHQNSLENFTYASSVGLTNENFISSSYLVNPLQCNTIDRSLKEYLIKKLKENNLLVSKDILTPNGIIDIVVKSPGSIRPSAINLDHLSYSSLESLILSFKQNKDYLDKLGYASYKIIMPSFFYNEKKEFAKLIDFIISNTINQKITHKVTTSKPLIEVIFKDYINPNLAYGQIEDKIIKSNKDIFLEYLSICAPVSEEETQKIFKDDYLEILTSLQANDLIYLNNNFIFLKNAPITFRKSDTLRKFEYVSNEEIAIGLKSILSVYSLKEDDLIKLILKSLGLKTMNYDKYFRVQNIISDLLEEDEISYKDEKLYIK